MKRTFVLAALILFAAPARAAEAPVSSCVSCHTSTDMFDEETAKHIGRFSAGVHAQEGLTCVDCHGGNGDPAVAGDMAAAMDPDFAPHPYVGAPERAAIPEFCGRCHSDPVYMKRFNPSARVDQVTEYWTSRHGRALREGDPNVATCVDCHGVHGIMRVTDTEAPVYPTHVAETCSGCHSDPERMGSYTRDDGSPLPVDQYARWRRSVHANALFEKEDLSAPTCNDCHGNHGAAPPGIESVALVCGQCHGREADLFRASPKEAGFAQHNEFLAEVSGEEACAACHSAPDPQATLTTVHGFGECTTCHENHGVVRPTVALLGPLPDTPCAFCHEGETDVAEPMSIRRNYVKTRDALLAEAGDLSGDERFDWLVDRAQELPQHTLAGESEGEKVLRPEFSRLFTKFRIGKTHYTYADPVTGEEVKAEVIRCTKCHSAEPSTGSDPVGLQASRVFLDRTLELTSLIAEAERVILAARRGGVETRGALADLDQAVDSQVELEVLVHTFSSDTTGAFVKKQIEGVRFAEAALATGDGSLDELGNRRRGLVVALVLIVLTLVGLGFRIRQISRRD